MAESLALLPEAERKAVLDTITEDEARSLVYDWQFWARDEQKIPSGDWRYWLILAGRGYGKTKTGGETVRQWINTYKRIHLIGPTTSDVRNVMLLGESGLLKCFPAHQRPHYEPSKHLITFHTGCVAETFSADEPERLRGPQCLVGSTSVLMADGSEKPIADVRAGDYVRTRHGARHVLDARLTNPVADVFCLRLVDGRSIIATGDHRVCVMRASSGTGILGTRNQGEATTKPDFCFIEKYGRLSVAQSRMDTTFITLTEISTITASRTSNFSARANTPGYITVKSSLPIETRHEKRLLLHSDETGYFESPGESSFVSSVEDRIRVEQRPRLHIVPERVSNVCAPAIKEQFDRANDAEENTFPRNDSRSTVRENAMLVQQQNESPAIRKLYALTVLPNSSVDAAMRGSVVADAPCFSMTEIESVEALRTKWPVYDLTVEDSHEFFANGILVHNCEAFWADEPCAWRFLQDAWDNLMFGFRLGADPRGVITTTPKPSSWLKLLMANPQTHITRGSSYDNRLNLAPAFFQDILKRYEGTRLGRQEIEAEVLEDIPGALWNDKLIDRWRIGAADIHWDQIIRVVVAIDPAVSAGEQSALTGIVVVALTQTQHVLVLDDLSCRESPLGWGRVAIGAYRSRRADRMVGEVNNGGDLVARNIYAIDPNVAFRSVRASRGKSRRAEPVAALYEQGRVHHVGRLPELEQQMCSYVPGDEDHGESPDRMDAMVWGVTELLLDPEEVTVQVDTGWSTISTI